MLRWSYEVVKYGFQIQKAQDGLSKSGIYGEHAKKAPTAKTLSPELYLNSNIG